VPSKLPIEEMVETNRRQGRVFKGGVGA
jgi:hypothetical protein